jgi:hypothetical protein
VQQAFILHLFPSKVAMGNPHFSTYPVTDPQHGGLTVFTFSYPTGWQAQSGVQWNFQNTTQPLSIWARAFNPQGVEAIEKLPIEQCFWLQMNYMYQPGQMVYGATCLQPMAPADMLGRWIIPKYRNQAPQLRIEFIKPAPELIERLRFSQPGARVDGVMGRVSYVMNGQPVEEEIYAIQVLLPPNGGQTNWGVPEIYTFRAPQGKLSDQRGAFWRFIHSITPNPVFNQVRDDIYQALNRQHMQHIHAWQQKLQSENDLSRMISAQNQQWLDQQAQKRESDWRTHEQKMQEWNDGRGAFTQNDAFGDMMLGRETYHDPQSSQGHSQHYGYHQHVWTDGQSYFYSDNPNDNPNIGSDRSWTELKKLQTRERYGN